MSYPWDTIRANGGLTISVHLNEVEVGNINGWVNKGFNEPGFADFPWRIVLEERSRARFDEIAAQFVAAGLTAYPPGWGTMPPLPPVVLPYDIWGEIPYGDSGRKIFAASSTVVTAFAFRTPTGPFPGPNGALLQMSAAENPSIGGSPWLRRLAISRVPGDMVGLMPLCIGKETMLSGRVGVELPAGELLYANHIITEPAPEGTTGTGFSINWPALVYP